MLLPDVVCDVCLWRQENSLLSSISSGLRMQLAHQAGPKSAQPVCCVSEYVQLATAESQKCLRCPLLGEYSLVLLPGEALVKYGQLYPEGRLLSSTAFTEPLFRGRAMPGR